MKYFNSLIAVLVIILAGVSVSSCGSDEPESEPKVYPVTGAPTSVTLDYLDVMEVSAVAFNSTADWSAEIFPANSSYEIQPTDSKTGSHVTWLEINPYKGGAGTIHCTLYAAPNHTNIPRYAVIRVNSATNYIDFKVKQNAMPSGGADDPTPGVGEE